MNQIEGNHESSPFRPDQEGLGEEVKKYIIEYLGVLFPQREEISQMGEIDKIAGELGRMESAERFQHKATLLPIHLHVLHKIDELKQAQNRTEEEERMLQELEARKQALDYVMNMFGYAKKDSAS